MKFNELRTVKQKSGKRVGRGIAAGGGKTAGRGTKGQNSRTGGGVRPGFEGGQNPLSQRLPKLRGFTSHRKIVEVVYTGQLNDLAAAIDNHTIAEAGLVSSAHVRVKLIQKGDITKKHDIKLQVASASAIAAIKKAGGSFTVVPQVGRVAKKFRQEKSA
jgi:large subunit ribosomal protein L15